MPTLFRAALPVALFTLAGLATSASAQIIQDGGFEAADSGGAGSTKYFSTGSAFDLNWIIAGRVGIDNQNVYVFGGDKSLYLNVGIGTDSITQNVATDPTQFYTLTFSANDDTAGDLLNVSFGGTALDPISVPANEYAGPGPAPGNDGRFTKFTFSGLTTASAFSALSFSSVGTLNGSQLEIDNISLESSPVPEASTSISLGLLFMLGLGAVFAAKKKYASAA